MCYVFEIFVLLFLLHIAILLMVISLAFCNGFCPLDNNTNKQQNKEKGEHACQNQRIEVCSPQGKIYSKKMQYKCAKRKANGG